MAENAYIETQRKLQVEKLKAALDANLPLAKAARLCGITPGKATRLMQEEEMQLAVGQDIAVLQNLAEVRQDRHVMMREKLALAAEKALDELLSILEDPDTEVKDRIKVAQDFLDRNESTQRTSHATVQTQNFSLYKEQISLAFEAANEIGIPMTREQT